MFIFGIRVESDDDDDDDRGSCSPAGDAGEGEPPAGRGGGSGEVPAGDGAHLREVHQAAGHERGAGHEDALHQLRAGEVRRLPQGPRGQAGRPHQEVASPGGRAGTLLQRSSLSFKMPNLFPISATDDISVDYSLKSSVLFKSFMLAIRFSDKFKITDTFFEVGIK